MDDILRQIEDSRPVLKRYLAPRVRGIEDANDLTQDVILAAVRNVEAFRGDCSVAHWVLRIAANHLKNYINRTIGKHHHHSLDEIIDSFEIDLQRNAERRLPYAEVDQTVLIERVKKLAEEACTPAELATLLMTADGESTDVIAIFLRTKPSTVRSHLFRGRGKLLAHVLRHAPELLGGEEAIRAASQQLSDRERATLSNPNGRADELRAVLLKLAPDLPLPVLVLLVGGCL